MRRTRSEISVWDPWLVRNKCGARIGRLSFFAEKARLQQVLGMRLLRLIERYLIGESPQEQNHRETDKGSDEARRPVPFLAQMDHCDDWLFKRRRRAHSFGCHNPITSFDAISTERSSEPVE